MELLRELLKSKPVTIKPRAKALNDALMSKHGKVIADKNDYDRKKDKQAVRKEISEELLPISE